MRSRVPWRTRSAWARWKPPIGASTAAWPSSATSAAASVDLPPPGAPAMPRIARSPRPASARARAVRLSSSPITERIVAQPRASLPRHARLPDRSPRPRPARPGRQRRRRPLPASAEDAELDEGGEEVRQGLALRSDVQGLPHQGQDADLVQAGTPDRPQEAAGPDQALPVLRLDQGRQRAVVRRVLPPRSQGRDRRDHAGLLSRSVTAAGPLGPLHDLAVPDAVAAVDRRLVVAGAACDRVLGPVAGGDRVVAAVGRDLVLAGAGRDRVVAVAAVELVAAGVAVHPIVAAGAAEHVLPAPAAHAVGA